MNNNKGASYDLNAGRSVSQENLDAFQPFWVGSWATETEFGFEPALKP